MTNIKPQIQEAQRASSSYPENPHLVGSYSNYRKPKRKRKKKRKS